MSEGEKLRLSALLKKEDLEERSHMQGGRVRRLLEDLEVGNGLWSY